MTASQTKKFLNCGVVAGIMLAAASFIQAFAREGFDVRRHPSGTRGSVHSSHGR